MVGVGKMTRMLARLRRRQRIPHNTLNSGACCLLVLSLVGCRNVPGNLQQSSDGAFKALSSYQSLAPSRRNDAFASLLRSPHSDQMLSDDRFPEYVESLARKTKDYDARLAYIRILHWMGTQQAERSLVRVLDQDETFRDRKVSDQKVHDIILSILCGGYERSVFWRDFDDEVFAGRVNRREIAEARQTLADTCTKSFQEQVAFICLLAENVNRETDPLRRRCLWQSLVTLSSKVPVERALGIHHIQGSILGTFNIGTEARMVLYRELKSRTGMLATQLMGVRTFDHCMNVFRLSPDETCDMESTFDKRSPRED